MVVGWQTYCPFSYPLTEADSVPSAADRIERVGRASPDIHSAFMFQRGEHLHIWDMANSEQFEFRDGSFELVASAPCGPFEAYGWTFGSRTDRIAACRSTDCQSVAIHPGTFPYMYAASRGGVLVATNYGDLLLFRDAAWCRMLEVDMVWRCIEGQSPEPPAEAPLHQFYASIRVGAGDAILGQYPTGALYAFTGTEVRHYLDMPVEAFEAEAQSLAYYCGDLYVGYWPRGEIWRLSHGMWHGPLRLFGTPPEPDIPHQWLANLFGLTWNFYGRRVPAMLPHEGALYAITSNKWQWKRGTFTPIFGADDYGALHRITREGC